MISQAAHAAESRAEEAQLKQVSSVLWKRRSKTKKGDLYCLILTFFFISEIIFQGFIQICVMSAHILAFMLIDLCFCVYCMFNFPQIFAFCLFSSTKIKFNKKKIFGIK